MKQKYLIDLDKKVKKNGEPNSNEWKLQDKPSHTDKETKRNIHKQHFILMNKEKGWTLNIHGNSINLLEFVKVQTKTD